MTDQKRTLGPLGNVEHWLADEVQKRKDQPVTDQAKRHPDCCPEWVRTGYAHTEICPAFDAPKADPGHPSRLSPIPAPKPAPEFVERALKGLLEALMGVDLPESVRAAHTAALILMEGPPAHIPMRGTDVELWLKRCRDEYPRQHSNDAWTALDDLLDDYRLRADTGSAMDALVGGPAGDESDTPYRVGGEMDPQVRYDPGSYETRGGRT